MHKLKINKYIPSSRLFSVVDGRQVPVNAILIDQFFGSKGCLDPVTGWPLSQITLLERSSRIGSTHQSEYRDIASRLVTLAGDNNKDSKKSLRQLFEECKPKWMQTFSELQMFEDYLIQQNIAQKGDITGSSPDEEVIEETSESSSEGAE